MMGTRALFRLAASLLLWLLLSQSGYAQDGVLRGTVSDPTGGRVAGAKVTVTNEATGVPRRLVSGGEGEFAAGALPPATYSLLVAAPGMASSLRTGIVVAVGATVDITVILAVAAREETLTVESEAHLVDTRATGLSSVVEERAIAELPLNGRRFTELALLTPGATEDPRGLTSAWQGDLAFGGVRGYHSSFLVDGSDNNNAFFAQARGRYRAPYQFSNEVVQEFRVSSNTYGADLGGSGGAVISVVTKSGSNHLRGSAFYYLRHYQFNARHPFTDEKAADRQHQYGFTLGGRLRKNRAFFFGGFDQHRFHVPMLVRFADGSTALVPSAEDYEATDRDLVFAAAERLSGLAGEFRSKLLGNAAFLKLDYAVSPRHYLTARFNRSRYSGQNNVFFDPASPITHFAASDNGEEMVRTENVAASWTAALSFGVSSQLRAQFSRDLQESEANSAEVRTAVDGILEGFGRSSILPRQTRERRLHLAEVLGYEGRRHSLKFGADFSQVWIFNYFPLLFGGQYIFDNVRVNQFTFVPQTFGLELTPLRAYAHAVPRYYIQNFGQAVSHPDSRDYALFAQDTLRVTDRLALSLGLRYDRQSFSSSGLEANPLWPGSGAVPSDGDNFAPRVGLAYSLFERRPLVFRGGFGLFYTRIPQIYNSAVENENGLKRTHLFLDNRQVGDRPLFPQYPNPLVACPPSATSCEPPAAVARRLTSDISAFATDFQTPYVQQASLSVEHEVWERLAVGVSYLYVRGRHLLRSRDLNLPEPLEVEYPVYSEDGSEFLDSYYTLESFSGWVMTSTLECPFPPCVAALQRPLAGLGAVNAFESAASSQYRGWTVSVRRRMTDGLYFRLAYTRARAEDDGQDALITGRPGNVQNSYAPWRDWGRSTLDQRHRLALSGVVAPRPFHQDRPLLKRLFNDWKLSGVVTVGSGRPVNARVVGDANRDANSFNDRLPGAPRNSFTGPDYATTNLRLSRRLFLTPRFKLDLTMEAFNAFNRSNLRVEISDDGFQGTAARFVPLDVLAGGRRYPAHYRNSSGFLRPTNAYAPRQVQLSLRLTY